MSNPKISLNKLGEYMSASASRRRSIIDDQINPKTFKKARYKDAREIISSFLASEIDEQELLQRSEKLRNQIYDSEFTTQDKNLSADAIENFSEVIDHLPKNYKFEKVPKNDASRLDIAGVSVTIRPDVYIKNDNHEIVGAIKLHFPKSNPLSEESLQFIATGLRKFLENNHEKINQRLCIVIDTPSSQITPAPKAFAKRMKDLEAACEEINNRWEIQKK